MTDGLRGIAAFLGFALLIIACPIAANSADEGVTPAQREAFEGVIRDYLLKHPEIIEEAVQVLRARRAAEEKRQAEEALVSQRSALYENPMSPVSGNAEGDVTVVEFFDYQCGYCKRTLGAMVDLLKTDKKIRVIWKELPILGPASEYAARAAIAAHRQDRYLDFHVGLMSLRGRLNEDKVMDTAARIGLDVARLMADMKDPSVTAYLNGNRQLADALNIRGTPAFIIGEQLVPGAMDGEAMKSLIAKARSRD